MVSASKRVYQPFVSSAGGGLRGIGKTGSAGRAAAGAAGAGDAGADVAAGVGDGVGVGVGVGDAGAVETECLQAPQLVDQQRLPHYPLASTKFPPRPFFSHNFTISAELLPVLCDAYYRMDRPPVF